MEAPLQAQCGATLEPMGFPTEPLSHMDPESCPSLNTGHLLQSEHADYLNGSQFSPNGTSTSDSAGSSTTINSSTLVADEEECLVDSQPICFKENPFLVANRKGKGRPPGEQILSGPPVGYGRQGQLQPWLFSKARRLPECDLEAAWCVTAHSLLFGSLMSLKMDHSLASRTEALWKLSHFFGWWYPKHQSVTSVCISLGGMQNCNEPEKINLQS